MAISASKTQQTKTKKCYPIFDCETGKMAQEPGGKIALAWKISGVCNIVATLTGKSKTENIPYQWEQSLTGTKSNQISIENMSEDSADTSPLVSGGGFVICRNNEKSEGADRIRPVFLLPHGWDKFVETAWKYYQTNSELFKQESAPKKREELSKLLRDENPLLAIQAWRVLGKAGLIEIASLRQPLSESRDFKQAALMFLFWKYAHENEKSAFVEVVSKIIEAAKSSEEIKGVALGALFTYEPFEGLQYELQIMRALGKKQSSLGIRTETDRYVDTLIREQLEVLTEQAKEHEERKKERAAQSRSE